MNAPNRNTLWGRIVVDELVKAGVDAACLAPGSRSTPLTAAFARHPEVETFSHLDERSAAFFALGRARRTGTPTPLVCTSGTALANFHPAVIEAHQSRVPMLLLTADRPRELQDSGANQTIDQEKLYGGAVRSYRTLPEPEAEPRKVRSLRTAVSRAVATTTGTPPGPVHLNVPFRKPLEPVEVQGDVPETWHGGDRLAAEGREGPFVRATPGSPTPDDRDVAAVVDAIAAAERGLVVCGPADGGLSPEGVADLAAATGFPVLADPLSGVRFGAHVPEAPICGGYDGYLPAIDGGPDVVLRFGASPTSKNLRHYLRDADCRQFVVDPAGGWREATFTASDLVVADEDRLAGILAARLERAGEAGEEWLARFEEGEANYWVALDTDDWFEGRVLQDVAELAPDPATVFVSNSMPVRDLDRFGRPREAALTVLGNRGASGIDGITSSALGAGSATEESLVLVTGDLAFYHDMNGLLAVDRCGVDATVVVVNNDGGGIFHLLPIEEYDPPFSEFFKTPHGLDFEHAADLYGLEFSRAASRGDFRALFEASVGTGGTQVIEVAFDAAASHRTREELTAEASSASARRG